MFWRKKNSDTAPVSISGTLGRAIAGELGKIKISGDHWADYRAVMRPRSEDGNVSDVRIFDNWSAKDKKVTVRDYASLDDQPDLVMIEGWFDKKSKKGEFKARSVA
jgi:hypothetical protein